MSNEARVPCSRPPLQPDRIDRRESASLVELPHVPAPSTLHHKLGCSQLMLPRAGHPTADGPLRAVADAVASPPPPHALVPSAFARDSLSLHSPALSNAGGQPAGRTKCPGSGSRRSSSVSTARSGRDLLSPLRTAWPSCKSSRLGPPELRTPCPRRPPFLEDLQATASAGPASEAPSERALPFASPEQRTKLARWLVARLLHLVCSRGAELSSARAEKRRPSQGARWSASLGHHAIRVSRGDHGESAASSWKHVKLQLSLELLKGVAVARRLRRFRLLPSLVDTRPGLISHFVNARARASALSRRWTPVHRR